MAESSHIRPLGTCSARRRSTSQRRGPLDLEDLGRALDWSEMDDVGRAEAIDAGDVRYALPAGERLWAGLLASVRAAWGHIVGPTLTSPTVRWWPLPSGSAASKRML